MFSDHVFFSEKKCLNELLKFCFFFMKKKNFKGVLRLETENKITPFQKNILKTMLIFIGSDWVVGLDVIYYFDQKRLLSCIRIQTYWEGEISVTASVCWFKTIDLREWDYFCVKEFFFRNFDFQNCCKNEFEDRKEKYAAVSEIGFSKKSILKAFWFTRRLRQRGSWG